jgi:isoleucyl-tRNA synthetase
MYREFKSLNLPTIDQELLNFWEENKIFEASVNQRPADNSWVFYEGPPSANGKPGIHHVMARAIKDIFCRYQTLKGKRVERKGGWDTHGLPIELSVEKELGITKEDIGKSISVDEYNHKCRETVMRYKNEWDDITRKMGYWVDLDNPYITYENEYIETVWWILKRLYDKGLLYKGYTIQPYSPGAGTGLSSHELNMPGAYREVTDTTVVALFKVLRNPSSAALFDDESEDVRIAAWTTTPWTLPSNTALTIGHQISYVKIKTENPYTHQPVSVVMAEPLVSKWFGGKNQPTVLEQSTPFTAQQLEGVRYEQLLPFGNEIEPMLGYDGEFHSDAFRVLVSDFVTTEDGTGVVHTAPSFGADDMKAAKANGIGALTLVDKQGKFKEAVGEFSNRYVKDYTDDPNYVNVDVDIAVKLKLEGKALNVAKYAHNYPHCWRTDKPVLYYPLDSWFIKASAVKERMFELNKTINWKPASTGEGRFGKWLENLQDWNLSRSRYWGIGLPIWRTNENEILPGKMTAPQVLGLLEKMLNNVFSTIDFWFEKPADLKNYQPKNGGWTVTQILEHVSLTNHFLMILIEKSVEKSLKNTEGASLEEVWTNYVFPQNKLADIGIHKSFDWVRPEHMEPKGERSLPEVREVLKNQLQECLEYLSHVSNGEGALHKTTMSVNDLGKIDTYEYLYFLAQHSKRHFTQMMKNEAEWAGIELKTFGEKAIGSVAELQAEMDKANKILGLTQTVPADLHRPYIDDIILVADNGMEMRRELDLIDVWFDSGSMPYAQWGLDLAKLKANADRPFNAPFDNMYPADFIAEGVDQTRGWFYTLHAIAVMAFDQVSFKNVVSNGLVLDKNGNKMSKRLGNAADPFETIAKYGADATRWYMISNAAPWENLKFDVEGIGEVQRKFFGTLFNTYNFFATYANIDGWKMDEFNVMDYAKRSELDRWVISKLYSLVADYHAAMDDYEPHRACRLVEDFVDEHLSNWYVRLSRRRFWRNSPPSGGAGGGNEDKEAAYQTLWECLMVVGQLASPIAPFFSDWLFRNMVAPIHDIAKQKNTPLRHDSVHLSDLTRPEPSQVDKMLERRMDYAQRICSLAFSIRKGNGLRVRLPLQKLLLPVLDERFITEVDGVKDLILSEINVKQIEYITDASGLLKKQAKANFKTLGAKLGKDMKAAAEQIAQFTNEEINALEKAGRMAIVANGNNFDLTPEDLVVTTEDLPGWKVASDGPLTVALDVTLTPELEAEGIARDLVNRIQNLRKDKEFNVTDRINVKIERHQILEAAVENFREYIKAEVLADSLILASEVEGDKVELTDELAIGIEVHQS